MEPAGATSPADANLRQSRAGGLLVHRKLRPKCIEAGKRASFPQPCHEVQCDDRAIPVVGSVEHVRLDSTLMVVEGWPRAKVEHPAEYSLGRLDPHCVHAIRREQLPPGGWLEIQRRVAKQSTPLVTSNHAADDPVSAPKPRFGTGKVSPGDSSADRCG